MIGGKYMHPHRTVFNFLFQSVKDCIFHKRLEQKFKYFAV